MKTIVIIGASRGIGNAIANQLSPDHRIINISRNNPDNLQNIINFNLDILTDTLPEIAAVAAFLSCPGLLHLKPLSRLKLDDFRNDFEINVMGAVRAIQHFLPKLKNGNNPSIVLFSTVAAKLGMPFHASIAAAKGAVEGITKSLGAELAPTIRVNAIAPTVTNTDLASKLLRNERMIENIKERHPLKKYLEPNEVAAMAKFLISDEAKSISGQTFELDCGIVSFKI